jgi:hypothetical protein
MTILLLCGEVGYLRGWQVGKSDKYNLEFVGFNLNIR